MYHPNKLRYLPLLVCVGVLAIAATAQAQGHIWSKRLGSDNPNTSELGYNVAVDPDGNVVVTGTFGGPTDFGGGILTPAGVTDIFVAKYDANGNHIWSRRFGGGSSDSGRDIAVDGLGNILVCGVFNGTVDFGGGPLHSNGFASDLFALKLDRNGAHVWSRVFGSPRLEEIVAGTFDPFGNAVVTGQFQETADFGGGPLTSLQAGDIFLAKYDPNGAHLWSESFGPGGWDDARGVVCDASGNIYVGGRFEQTIDLGGGPRTGYNFFVAKYDPNGNHIDDRNYGGPYIDTCYDIALDNDGNILLTGFFRGTVDFGGGPITATGNGDIYVLKLAPDFSYVWSRGMGGTNTGLISLGYRIAADSEGNAVVTGYFNTTVDFGGGPVDAVGGNDLFLAKYDATGGYVWSREFGAEGGYAQGLGVAVDAAGDVVMTGTFAGTIDFGGGPVEALGRNDIVLAKYSGGPFAPTARARLDLMAGACPPPFNVKSRGVLPVAILGTDEVDVNDIDVSTLRLEGAEPVAIGSNVDLRTAGALDGCDCNGFGPDGYADLEVRFMTQDVVNGMTPGTPGDEATLTLTGALLDGTPFVARDCVQIIGGGRPSGTALKAAVPNPFNPVTTISYDLAERMHVELSIYDVQGKLVATLTDHVVEAGEHSIVWNANGRPSGMYFLRMTAGDYVQVRRMLLLK